ncbi:MAG: ABC transporter substrate-binding protein [Clostridia bacterium]|nr:ABC transporter substrate-binding protein [Clostridia bacterium]
MKKLFLLTLCFLFAMFPLSACSKSDGKTIELNEVTHSVFYAPLYIAIENGYFKEEGVTVNLTNGGGADNSMTAVLSGTAHIGLMGPETVIYVKNQGKKDAPKVFAGLTQRDGAFLVSRIDEPDFNWENLRGKEILAGRKGGVPAMSFEYVLNQMGFTSPVDYTLNYDVQFNMMTSAFVSGTADYCTVFEPTASEYEEQGKWHVVASVGAKAGEIPYTSFIALSSYINNNADTIRSFLKAMKKAYAFLNTHTDLEVAESIVKQFPSTTIRSIEKSIESYRGIEAWKTDMQPTEESFTRLQNIMENSGELSARVPYSEIVDLKLAKEIFG